MCIAKDASAHDSKPASYVVQPNQDIYWSYLTFALMVDDMCLPIGGPPGSMGTLEDAMLSIFGDCIKKTTGTGELTINNMPGDKAQTFAHTLRHLLLQHQEQRLCLNRKVKSARDQIQLATSYTDLHCLLLAPHVFVHRTQCLLSSVALDSNYACCVQSRS